MWINRDISDFLLETANQRPSILVTGPRQTGKTSLLTRLFPDHQYTSLDIPAHAREAEESGDLFLNQFSGPLIIDEIQYAPKLFHYIKQRIDRQRDRANQFIMTGSQKFSLMQHVSESLAGRTSIIELHSLSARELAHWQNINPTADQLLEWIVTGGYPEIHAKNLSAERFYGDYVATYLERDVRQLINVRDLRDFDRFLRLAATRTGQLLSLNSMASDVGISPKTAKSWLSVLEASNTIHLLEPYYENLGKRLVKTPKLYFLDTGLACYLTGIKTSQQLKGSPMLGAMFETHSFGQLIRYAANQGLKANIYFYRDHHGHEVDFLVPSGNQFALYECKWSQNPQGDVKGFSEIESLVGPKRVLSKNILAPIQMSYLDKSRNIAMHNTIDLKGV